MRCSSSFVVVCLSISLPLAAAASDGLPQDATATASRLDSRALRPVLVLDRKWIEASGKFSVAELLRDLPLNTAGAARAHDAFLRQPVQADVNLRGLSADATLVLVDGRRAASAPLLGQSTDLLSLPLALIERVEVYPDGAGAVHGADAAAGVINLVTRAGHEGVEFVAGRSESQDAGGELEQGSALFGLAGARARVMVGAAYDERSGRSGEQPSSPGFDTTAFGNNFSPLPGQGGLPSGVSQANVAGCQGPGYFLEAGRCRYDLRPGQILDMNTRNESLFSRASFRLDDDWSVFLHGPVSRSQLQSRFAPPRITGFDFQVAPGSPNHPATPPLAGGLNPLWQDYAAVADRSLLIDHTFAANGAQARSENTNTYAVDLGVTGRIGGLDLEAGLRSNESTLQAQGRNNLISALVQAQIDDGGYNLYDPFATPDDVLGSMEAVALTEARWRERSFWATARAEPLSLPAGPVATAFGIEVRDLDSRIRRDPLSGTMLSSLLPPLNSARADRETVSLFSELEVPILETLSANAALRWDDTDDLGDVLNARVALGWRPLSWIDARLSWARSGQSAPVTQDLQFTDRAFTVNPTLVDDASCQRLGFEGAPCSIISSGTRIINPDLEHAITTQFGAGLTVRPLAGLAVTIDAFDLELTDRIRLISPNSVVQCWLGGSGNNTCPSIATLDPAGFGPEDGLGVLVQPIGQQVIVQYGLINAGRIDLRGIDFGLQGDWATRFGRFRTDVQATWTERYRIDSNNSIGALPEWRGQWANRAQFGAFELAWFANWIGSMPQAFTLDGDGFGSWITHDLQLAWNAPWNGTIVLGVDNLTDREPTRRFSNFDEHDTRFYDDYGRLGYLRYVQRF